jgi:hypothetical protein
MGFSQLFSIRKIFSAFCVGLCCSPQVAALLNNVHIVHVQCSALLLFLSNIYLFLKMRLGNIKFSFSEFQHMRNNYANFTFHVHL